jgi:hypothetical protein
MFLRDGAAGYGRDFGTLVNQTDEATSQQAGGNMIINGRRLHREQQNRARFAPLIPHQQAFQVQDMVNKLVERAFLPVLSNSSVGEVTTWNHWINHEAVDGGPRFHYRPGNLIFTCLPLSNPGNNILIDTNCVGNMEFNRDGSYNAKYWKNQTQLRTSATGKRAFMELGITIPKAFMHPRHLTQHQQAIEEFQSSGCGVGHDYCKLCLYAPYNTVMTGLLLSEPVTRARCDGWQPVFLMKHALLQRSAYGKNNQQFASCNLQGRSSIALLGFYRMEVVREVEGTPTESVEVLGMSVNDQPITFRSGGG